MIQSHPCSLFLLPDYYFYWNSCSSEAHIFFFTKTCSHLPICSHLPTTDIFHLICWKVSSWSFLAILTSSPILTLSQENWRYNIMNTWFLNRLIFSDTSATHSHKHIVNLVITSKIMDSSISPFNYSFPHFLLQSYLPLSHSRASSFFLFFCLLHFSGLSLLCLHYIISTP